MSLRPVLLALLSKEPNSGYGLGRLLEGELSHVWSARLQQIYGELAKLEATGLVEAETIELSNRPAKKIYSLTASGLASLDEWLSVSAGPEVAKDDLIARVYCVEHEPGALLRQLEERQRESEAQAVVLRQRIAEAQAAGPSVLGRRLTLEASLSRTEAHATWCGRPSLRSSTLCLLRASPAAHPDARSPPKSNERLTAQAVRA